MEIRFTGISKDTRKELVKAVGEATGWEPVYKGAPGFGFAVNNYIIDRAGTLIYDERTAEADVRDLLAELAERGFVCEGGIIGSVTPSGAENDGATPGGSEPESGARTNRSPPPGGFDSSEGNLSGESASAGADADSGKMPINALLYGFTASSLENLTKLVAAKSWILKKMTGADELPIERDETHLRFPWFKRGASAAEIDAYSRLIAGLCETAKKKQRVVATERQLDEGDNEKFKARCFLLSLDFIGKDYAQARKVLLAPMSGSGSHKSGGHKRTDSPNGATAAGDGETQPFVAVSHEAAEPARIASDAAVRLRCDRCDYHSYFTEGSLRTGAGDIVDTSSRTPNKYTHYCLKAPSGFRKIKHAAEWSGYEMALKWCPLYAESSCAVAGEAAAV